MIIDDYGNPNIGIKKAIDELVESNIITPLKWIGEDAGYKTAAGWTMNDKEGGIFKLN